MEAVTHAVLAVVATSSGDHGRAREHLETARTCSRTAARRERQLVEIAALVVAGDRDRARDLCFEHSSQFPDDALLLCSLLAPGADADHRGGVR